MMQIKIKIWSPSTTNRKSFTPAPGTAATLPSIMIAMAAKKKTYSSKIWSKTKWKRENRSTSKSRNRRSSCNPTSSRTAGAVPHTIVYPMAGNTRLKSSCSGAWTNVSLSWNRGSWRKAKVQRKFLIHIIISVSRYGWISTESSSIIECYPSSEHISGLPWRLKCCLNLLKRQLIKCHSLDSPVIH